MSNFNPRTLTQLADAFGGDMEKYRQPTKKELNEGGWRVKGNHRRRVGPDGSADVPIYEKIDQEDKEEDKPEAKPAAPAPAKPEITDKPKVQEAVQRAQTHLKNKSEVSVMPAGDDEAMNVKAEFDASKGMSGIGQ